MKSPNKASMAACHTLLLNCSPEKRKALFKFLPQETQQRFQEMTSPKDALLKKEDSLDLELSLLHPSWLAPYLRTLTESEIRLFLSSLNPEQGEHLQKILLFTSSPVPLTPLAKKYLQKTLWKKVGGEEQLPLVCLPVFSLNRLLSLSDFFLNKLIFFLGLRDLAHEMRQIIETAKLKKIQTALSPDEIQFLKGAMLKKEPVAFKKISLSQWDGEKKSLRKILYGRGINRLSKALYGQNESLAWYLSHKMDIETAKQFLKLLAPLDQPRAKEVLIYQVQEILEHLQTITSGKKS